MARKTARPALVISADERKELERLRASRKAPKREVERASILLHYNAGESPTLIHKALGMSRVTIYKCIDKALAAGVAAGLKDRYHRPREPVFTATKCTVASFHMVDSVPSSIQLSLVQREILDLIIQDPASIQGPVQPERVILLWSEGASESTTAQKLGISEEEVRSLRYRWWASTTRIAAAEKKTHKAFNELVSLNFRIPNEETPSETASNSSVGGIQTSSSSQRKPAEHKELRSATRALIEILEFKFEAS